MSGPNNRKYVSHYRAYISLNRLKEGFQVMLLTSFTHNSLHSVWKVETFDNWFEYRLELNTKGFLFY
jgi:hypothetical protein